MTNYIFYGDYSFTYKAFLFIDTTEYLSSQIFAKHNVKIKYIKTAGKPDLPYKIIICKVKNKYVEEFLKALDELEIKMLLTGHPDYPSFCQNLFSQLGH